jgi:hypothetical protein
VRRKEEKQEMIPAVVTRSGEATPTNVDDEEYEFVQVHASSLLRLALFSFLLGMEDQHPCGCVYRQGQD